jgi:hypothetical protein
MDCVETDSTPQGGTGNRFMIRVLSGEVAVTAIAGRSAPQMIACGLYTRSGLRFLVAGFPQVVRTYLILPGRSRANNPFANGQRDFHTVRVRAETSIGRTLCTDGVPRRGQFIEEGGGRNNGAFGNLPEESTVLKPLTKGNKVVGFLVYLRGRRLFDLPAQVSI